MAGHGATTPRRCYSRSTKNQERRPVSDGTFARPAALDLGQSPRRVLGAAYLVKDAHEVARDVIVDRAQRADNRFGTGGQERSGQRRGDTRSASDSRGTGWQDDHARPQGSGEDVGGVQLSIVQLDPRATKTEA